ncbi:hypothetical protein [Streptomyces sp. NPDC015125]|uniref:hypothetical protein n=1 Tax=Streptomyces sp. NPDC015125 TaxID=3364938 RepID=UPI0036FCD6C8
MIVTMTVREPLVAPYGGPGHRGIAAPASRVALLAAAVDGPGKRFDGFAESWHSGAP